MADLTGYTAYLTGSELEHAGPILSALLGRIIDAVQAPLEIANLEGDAVFFRAPEDGFISAQSLLELCEKIYFSFADLRRQMVANTTCSCRACANIGGLDLKIMSHFGEFAVMEPAGRKELSGSDVILLHRMAKTDIRAGTGVQSYLLFTRAQAEKLGITRHPDHLLPYAEQFEHFGRVDMIIHDLGAAWQSYQNTADPVMIRQQDAFWSASLKVGAPAMLLWDYLVLPEHKKNWTNMISVDAAGGPAGRHGIGTDYHCVHTDVDVRFRIVDWRPFEYFSALEADPMGSGLHYLETWAIEAKDDAIAVRFSVAGPEPGPGRGDPATAAEKAAIYGLYEAYAMPMLEGLRDYAAARA